MSLLGEISALIGDVTGIAGRREEERAWRANAAAARPGEVWTAVYESTDDRRRPSTTYVSGQVAAAPRRRGGTVKMLGRQILTDQEQPLAVTDGLLQGKVRAELSRGQDDAPKRLPAATGRDLEAIETGQLVWVEYRDPATPNLRRVQRGYTGWTQARDGRPGRPVGDTWVPFEHVIGFTFHDEIAFPPAPPAAEKQTAPTPAAAVAAVPAPRELPATLTAGSGLIADGAP